MATLPRELETTTIGTMQVGETRFADPDTMYADLGRVLWLYDIAMVVVGPDERYSMRVELRDDGYHVWPVPGHTYKPEELGPLLSDGNVPVQELHEVNRRCQ